MGICANPKVRGKESAVEMNVPMLLPHEFLHELVKAGELQEGMSSKSFLIYQNTFG